MIISSSWLNSLQQVNGEENELHWSLDRTESRQLTSQCLRNSSCTATDRILNASQVNCKEQLKRLYKSSGSFKAERFVGVYMAQQEWGLYQALHIGDSKQDQV